MYGYILFPAEYSSRKWSTVSIRDREKPARSFQFFTYSSCSEHQCTELLEKNKVSFRTVEHCQTTLCQTLEFGQEPCTSTSHTALHLRNGSSHHRRAYRAGQRAKNALSLLAVTHIQYSFTLVQKYVNRSNLWLLKIKILQNY